MKANHAHVLTVDRAKKPKVSVMLSDDDDEEENRPKLNSFTQRLTKFKRSPTKGKPKGQWLSLDASALVNECIYEYTARKVAGDDDDVFVPNYSDDDIEDDEPKASTSRAPSRSSKASSRPSSRQSDHSNVSDDDSDVPKKAKPATKKSTAARRPALKQNTSAKSGDMFLTAAEQRAQQQKEEKKSEENPFSFLVDVRDKDKKRPGDADYDPRTLYIPPSAWKQFTPFEKQVRPLSLHLFSTFSHSH